MTDSTKLLILLNDFLFSKTVQRSKKINRSGYKSFKALKKRWLSTQVHKCLMLCRMCSIWRKMFKQKQKFETRFFFLWILIMNSRRFHCLKPPSAKKGKGLQFLFPFYLMVQWNKFVFNIETSIRKTVNCFHLLFVAFCMFCIKFWNMKWNRADLYLQKLWCTLVVD